MESGQGSARVLPLRPLACRRLTAANYSNRPDALQGRACYHSRVAGTVPSLMLECIADLSGYISGSRKVRLAAVFPPAVACAAGVSGQQCRIGCRTGFAASVLHCIVGIGRDAVNCRTAGKSVHRWRPVSGSVGSCQFALSPWCWLPGNHDRSGCHAYHMHHDCRAHRVVHVHHAHRHSPDPVSFSRIPSADSLFAY